MKTKILIIMVITIIGFMIAYRLGPVPEGNLGFFGRVADACNTQSGPIGNIVASECARQTQARLFNGIVGATVGLSLAVLLTKNTGRNSSV